MFSNKEIAAWINTIKEENARLKTVLNYITKYSYLFLFHTITGGHDRI
jgi:hypothetical protein